MVCIAAFIILAIIGVFVAIISIFKPKVGKAYWKMFKKRGGAYGRRCNSKSARLGLRTT